VPNQLASLLPIIAILLAFWFLVLRPARKRQTEARRLHSSLAVGDEVMLTSGIFGRVITLDEERLTLEVAPAVAITAVRQAVAKVVDPAPADSRADSSTERSDDHPDDHPDDPSDGRTGNRADSDDTRH